MRGHSAVQIFSAVLLLFLILPGCVRGEKSNSLTLPIYDNHPGQNNAKKASCQHKKELTVWSFYELDKGMIGGFEKAHPGFTIKTQTFDFNEALDAYLESLVEGNAPDVFVIDSGFFSYFSGMDAMQDLLSPPYAAERYREKISPALWNSMLSFDGRKLLAMPLSTSPAVTYYRTDILAQYGFPTDSEALAKYIANEENWINMAVELKKHNVYITPWVSEAIDVFANAQGIFDRKMDFQRNNNAFSRALNIARSVKQRGIDSRIDIWQEEGREAVRDGRIAMLYLGSWGEDTISAWAPETNGLWRVTGSPFGVYGTWGGASMAISGQSDCKEEAWEFIRYQFENPGSALTTVPANLDYQHVADDIERPHPFLGGQQAYAVYQQAVDRMTAHIANPLNPEAENIWRTAMNEQIQQTTDTKTAIDQVEIFVMDKLRAEIKIVRDYLDSKAQVRHVE